MDNLSFYQGKRVFVTGHTGFKGVWLCRILIKAGAIVTGYSLEPPTQPSLFQVAGLQEMITSIIGDIRDFGKLMDSFTKSQPEIVFHLAAQPIVRESYHDPRYTYDTNVMGTVNLLECVRLTPSVKSVLNVTTDKVYHNHEWHWGYREDDALDGFDPYSNSKSCSELVTGCYKRSFFTNGYVAVSTARAGNVIGGGDFAKDRIIPDCVRAITDKRIIQVRNPYSTRPYQHVLDPLFAYLMISAKQYANHQFAGHYNIGPDDCDILKTGNLVDLFCHLWGEGATWESQAEAGAPHEATFLKLDCSKVRALLNWKPNWNISKAMEMTCKFSRVYLAQGDIPAEMDDEIREFMEAWV